MDIVTLFVILIGIAVLSGILRLVFFIFAVSAVLRQYNAAMAQQRRLLAHIAAAGQAEQDAFVRANQASGQALVRMKPAEQQQKMGEMTAILSQLAAVQNGGRWSNGAYFERGNVVIPGGASLIDGKLFVPGLRV